MSNHRQQAEAPKPDTSTRHREDTDGLWILAATPIAVLVILMLILFL